MTRHAAVLEALEPAAFCAMHPRELERLGLRPGDFVRVSTRRGSVECTVRADRAVPEGVVFMPFAYHEAAANLLTNPQLDPWGKIPEFKFCACRIERVEADLPAAE